jgi:hypothetical protein
MNWITLLDRRKAMNEKNAFFSFIAFLLPCTVLDTTADDIQEARDDNGGDDARSLASSPCRRS